MPRRRSGRVRDGGYSWLVILGAFIWGRYLSYFSYLSWGAPLREPIPSEPSLAAGADGDAFDGDAASAAGPGAAAAAAGDASGVTASRKVSDGTKKRLPVTARLKSRIRS